MLSYNTTKRLAKAEEEFKIIKAQNALFEGMETRGQLVWVNKGPSLGREVYLSRIIPMLQALADAENEDELKTVLDAENL